MRVEVEDLQPLRFADGSPVRAASGVELLGDGYLVVQDDGTEAAWVRPGGVEAVRLVPPVEGLDVFEESSGTKHLKPDLEAACRVEVGDTDGVLVLGSGSSDRRMRWSLVTLDGDRARSVEADLTPVYAVVADALGVDLDQLNLEGASTVDGRLRWYHRGLPSAGSRSGSVDLDLETAVAAVLGTASADRIPVTHPRHYDLGEVDGVGLAVTDSVVLPDGSVLVSAAAEDSPDVRRDGPVVGSALVLLDGERAVDAVDLPHADGAVAKVEGLTLLGEDGDAVRLLAVVDADDPGAPSLALTLRLSR